MPSPLLGGYDRLPAGRRGKGAAISLEETYRIEREKWDSIARDELAELPPLPGGSFVDYARDDSVFRFVPDLIGDVRGLEVLEYGCGRGTVGLLLARDGAHVHGFDISPTSIEVARRRAQENGLEDRIELTVAAGEALPFADASFDLVIGRAILHHLNAAAGAPELYRVLRPGGRAVFSEPMGMNPVLNFVRDRVPYPYKTPRGADRPLSYDDIEAWLAPFPEWGYREFQLLSMVERMFGFQRRMPLLRDLDNRLLGRYRGLRRYARYVTIWLAK